MQEQAFDRQAELLGRLSEYITHGDFQSDTAEAMTEAMFLARSVLDDARDRARDAGCSDRGWCEAFRQGVEQTAALWAWEDLRDDYSDHQVYTWNTAVWSGQLADVAQERAEAAGCACQPWSEARKAWERYLPSRGDADLAAQYFDLTIARIHEAAETCWPDRR